MDPFSSARESFTYPEFLELTKNLVANKTTTGADKSEEMVDYTRLNLHRMERWNRTFHPREDLVKQLREKKQSWWMITEPWCGDSSQSLPFIGRIAEAADIPFRIVLRDDNLEIMDQYLTNNSRSVPILVAFDEDGVEIFRWGPRPAAVQQIVLDWKREPQGRSYEQLKEEVHTWYARNKGVALQQELMELAAR